MPRTPPPPATPRQAHDAEYNRDQDQKAGRPQRMAQEPRGSESSSCSPKLATDPASGEPNRGRPDPAQAEGKG